MKASVFKRLGCALALTGLLIRLAVALIYVPSMVAQNNSALALGEGQFKIVYCSLLGTMAVPNSSADSSGAPGAINPGDLSNPENTPPAPADTGSCPLCQAISATTFAVPPADCAHAPPAAPVDTHIVDAGSIRPPSQPIRATARGPPVRQA